MSKSQALAASAAAFLAVVLFVNRGPAQQNPGAAAGRPLGGQPVYLLDTQHVFKNYTKLKVMKEEMQGDVQRAEERVRNEREAIKKLQERLEEFKSGTENYRQLEKEIATRIADLNVLVTLQRKEFLQQEARIYFIVYREVMDEVHYFAAQNRAALVLKFDRDEVDVESPDSVVRALNKSVIWNSPGLDITDYILGRLNDHLQSGPVSPHAGLPRRPIN